MSPADIVAIAVGVGGLIATVLLGIQNNRIAERQNEIFREQNRIFATQAGVNMPETIPKKNTLGLYWPTIAAAFTAVVVGVVVSRLQGSLVFAGASSLIMLLAFGAVYWRERSVRPHILENSPSITAPLAPTSVTTKPLHNVQCVGFKFLIDPPLDVAGLYFQNVPIPGKLIGKFEYPRLRVVYYDNSTGQEIADMCPLQWHGSEYGLSEITAAGGYAEIAVFLMGANVWRIFEKDESSDAFKLNHKEIPAGEYRIIAPALIVSTFRPSKES